MRVDGDIDAGTRIGGVIGWPIRHSLSPTIVNAAFRVMGLDWVFVGFEVPPDKGRDAVDAMRSLGLGGLSVTMPHKAAANAAVDARTAVAEALEAVNCIFWQGDRLVGDNTDAGGFIDALRADAGFDPSGLACAVVGAGGAGRAAAWALGQAGAAEVVIINRSASPAERAASVVPHGVGRVGQAPDVADVDLVVNATPVGMRDEATGATAMPIESQAMPVDPARLRAGQVVVDLIYHPETTPLLGAARAQGAVGVNGLAMLIHQASHALERWTGTVPTPEVRAAMRHAAETRLRRPLT